MAGAKSIRAGGAFVEIGATLKGLQRDLAKAGKMISDWGKSVASVGKKIAAAGAAGFGGLLGAAKIFSDAGDALDKMSKRTGISAEALSALGYAAGLSGTDLETVEGTIRKMQKSLVEAASGSASAQEALAELGLSASELAALKPEEQFEAIGDRLSRISDPTKRAALAMEIFGKSGTSLLPMFEKGAAGLRDMMEEGRALGQVMTGEQAAAAAELNDNLGRLQGGLLGVVKTIGAGVAPVINQMTPAILGLVRGIVGWIRENQSLIATAFKVSAALTVAGGAIFGLGKALQVVGTILQSKVLVALLPVAAMIGGVAAAMVALELVSTGSFESIAAGWQNLKETALAAWGGIVDALKSGDLALAGKIALNLLRVAWLELKAWLTAKWNDFLDWFGNAFGDTGWDAAQIVSDAFHWVLDKVVQAVAWAVEALAVVFKALHDAWQGAQNVVAQGVAWIIAKTQGLRPEEVLQTLEEDWARTRKPADISDFVAKVEDWRKAQIEAVEAQRKAAEERIKVLANPAKRREVLDRELEDARKAVDLARAELTQSVAEAHAKAAEKAASETARNLPALNLPAAAKQTMESKLGTIGTFSAFGAPGLGMLSPINATAKNTEKIAENTEKLVRMWQREKLGLEFEP